MSSLFTACIFHCTSRCFFFPVFRTLTGTCTELFFFSWNCILRKENIFAYLLSGTFIGWQLQNKLFTKPGLLTGSSGQTFQIKLNYCSSVFFHLSTARTLFGPECKISCVMRKYIFIMVFLCPAKTQPSPCIFTKSD